MSFRWGRWAIGRAKGWDARIASRLEERAAAQRWLWGYAIRRDWPDGEHDLDCFGVDVVDLERVRRRFLWRWHPFIKPVAVTIVAANCDQVRTHVPFCTSALCPSDAIEPGVTTQGRKRG